MIKSFLQKLNDELVEIRFSAASLAFSTLFSLIPFLIVILAFFQIIGGVDQYYPLVESVLLSYLKEATGSSVTQYLKQTLGLALNRTFGITGIIFLFFSSMGLLRNIDIAFHRIWKIKIRKPFYKRMWLYSLIMMSAPAQLAAFIGLRSIDAVSRIRQSVEHQFWFSVSIAFVLWILYTVIPDTKVSRLGAVISAVAASAALTVVQNSFLWAAVKVFKQNKIYGSLASFPIFLLWLLIVWSIILAGVSLCAFLQQKVFKST